MSWDESSIFNFRGSRRGADLHAAVKVKVGRAISCPPRVCLSLKPGEFPNPRFMGGGQGTARPTLGQAARRGLLFFYLLSSILYLPLLGCVSQKKAKAQARAAFMAGQQASVARPPQPARDVVTLVGPVKVPSLQWTQDLTLAKAIINAGYESAIDPKQIMIVRNGQAVPVDPKALLAGQDVPLLPGDMILLEQ